MYIGSIYLQLKIIELSYFQLYKMRKYDYSIDEEIAILEKYRLQPNELFVVKTILLLQQGYPENYLFRFLQIPEEDRGDFRSILIGLQNKNIINKSYKIPDKGEEFSPDEIPINKVFMNNLFKASFDMGVELLEHYPMFGEINGAIVSLKGISSKFNSLEDFFRFYGKQIRWNQETHDKIIELLDWEQNNEINFINQSLGSFVINNGWNELEALKNGDGTYNYRAIKQL